MSSSAETPGRGLKDSIARGDEQPQTLPLQPEGIPQELRDIPQWVGWRWERRDSKWTKPPVNPHTGRHANKTKREHCGTFDQAYQLVANGRAAGVGFVFSADDPFCGIDLDDCRHPESGELLSWARKIGDDFKSCSDISPSGTGIKIICRAGVSNGKGRRKGNIEVYDRGSYFTLTGHVYDGLTQIRDCQADVDKLLAWLNGTGPAARPQAQLSAANADDQTIIEKARRASNGAKFSALFDRGDCSGYGGDESAADLALANQIAFYAGPDAARIERVFSASALGQRDKWKRRQDYRTSTIAKALEGRTKFYQWNRRNKGVGANGYAQPKQPEPPEPDPEEVKAGWAAAEAEAAALVRPPPLEAADDPHRLARLALDGRYRTKEGELTLQTYRGEPIIFDGVGWRTLPADELRATLTATTKTEFDRIARAARQAEEADEAAEEENGKKAKKKKEKKSRSPLAQRVTKHLITDIENAARSLTILPASVETPAWLDTPDPPFRADEVLVATNGIVHLPSVVEDKDHFHPCTPRLFTFNVLDYGFDASASEPKLWLQFLAELWPNDEQAIQTLRDWFGYMLTADTRLHKMLLLIGPPRSGKGTIARVLRQVVGVRNVCGPTLASLETNFGLWPLLNKTVAIVSDARLSGRTDQAKVTERLLSISGEDAQTIDRKYLQPITTKLNARFTIISNELPRLADTSGALPSRMIVLRLTQSWLGRENTALTGNLLTELPGILNWAVGGYHRVRVRGTLIQPQSGRDLIAELDDLSSPVGAFIRDCCVVEPGRQVAVEDLFGGWRRWCEYVGRREAGTVQTFGRDLLAAEPSVRRTQPRSGETRFRAYEGIGLTP